MALLAMPLAGECGRRSASPPLPPPEVTVARPIPREVIEWDEYTGRLDAVDVVNVQARVSGLIVSAPFQEGAIVKRGDLLFEIDVRPFQADLDSKLAAVAQDEAQLDQAAAKLKRTEAAVQSKLDALATGMLEAIRDEGQQADPMLERAIGIDEQL